MTIPSSAIGHEVLEEPRSRISPLAKVAAWAIVCGNVALILGAVYLYFFHVQVPIEFRNLPFPVDKAVYKQGETVEMTVSYCKYWEGEFTLQRSFVDGLIHIIPPETISGAPAGCRTIHTAVHIPEALPPGVYHIAGLNAYHVNVLRDRTVSWGSVKFEVVDDGK